MIDDHIYEDKGEDTFAFAFGGVSNRTTEDVFAVVDVAAGDNTYLFISDGIDASKVPLALSMSVLVLVRVLFILPLTI